MHQYFGIYRQILPFSRQAQSTNRRVLRLAAFEKSQKAGLIWIYPLENYRNVFVIDIYLTLGICESL